MPSTYQKVFPSLYNSRQVTRFYKDSWAVAKTCRSWSWDIWDRCTENKRAEISWAEETTEPPRYESCLLIGWLDVFFWNIDLWVLLLRKSQKLTCHAGDWSHTSWLVSWVCEKVNAEKYVAQKCRKDDVKCTAPCCVFSRWCLRHATFAVRKTISQRKVPAMRISSHMKSSKRKKAMKNWVMSVNCQTALPARGPAYTTAVFGSNCRRRLQVWSRRTKKGSLRCDLPCIILSVPCSHVSCRRIPRRWSGRSPWHGSAGKHEKWAEEASERTGTMCSREPSWE